MDERWAGRRVYGWEPGDPDDPFGPDEGHAYLELTGGPLDGQLLDITGWTPQMIAGGALLMCDTGAFGFGGRADYEPADSDAPGPVDRYVWRGDSP
ncbi:hypothetical protein [Streptomyces sp. NPDC048606]|uniref:hypothetical protein n=1 Tax=Streptomyces sp. NPDC048606 TaxID=3154726 RepID=UPI00343149A4